MTSSGDSRTDKLRVSYNLAGGVPRVRCKYNRSAPSDLLGDFVRVNVIAILFRERRGDSSELQVIVSAGESGEMCRSWSSGRECQ